MIWKEDEYILSIYRSYVCCSCKKEFVLLILSLRCKIESID
ncbi:hypothetical protein CBF_1657 [Clostridium botulinum F str. 230613]|nr:hypothetical protein CBF_1657 [Clostridium botulinum F str. 230613]